MRDWDRHVARVMDHADRVFGREVSIQSKAPVPFGETAPAPVTLRAVFDAAHREVDTSMDVPITTVRPICDARIEDLPFEPMQGDQLTADGRTYTITDIRPDGAGTVRLIMREGALTRW